MAQTALAFKVNEATGYTVGLSEKEIQKLVKNMLQDFKKLPGRIRAAENAAQGKGLTIARGVRLTKREEELAAIGRYAAHGHTEHMHVQKAEVLFAQQAQIAATQECTNTAEALDEIAGIMVGSRAFGGEAVVWNGIVMYQEQAMELASRDAQSLRDELETTTRALADLEAVDRHAALILRSQYVERQTVVKTISSLIELLRQEEPDAEKRAQIDMVEATYHRWRKEAMESFGKLVGLC